MEYPALRTPTKNRMESGSLVACVSEEGEGERAKVSLLGYTPPEKQTGKRAKSGCLLACLSEGVRTRLGKVSLLDTPTP